MDKLVKGARGGGEKVITSPPDDVDSIPDKVGDGDDDGGWTGGKAMRRKTSGAVSTASNAVMEIEPLPADLEGLTCLEKLNYVRVELPPRAREPKLGFMEKNVYNIVDIERNVVMKASEEDSSFKKLLAGPARDIHLKFTSEKDNAPLFEMLKRGRCDGLLCGLCLHWAVAEAKTGSSVGEVRQKFQVNYDQFLVWDTVDSTGDPFAILTAAKCIMHRCNTENRITIESFSSGEELGEIRKIWGPRLQMVNMDHEMFYLEMDIDLSVKQKAALIVAAFLMHYAYMEIS
ncbi:phospholipid scramblase 3-like [Convolutriloba macropyga]|uniref:phospholipid scramblase 3-like n=1 Tax=Convolutriloba macropyga TaxID=536237 RepID=UPI003F5222D1